MSKSWKSALTEALDAWDKRHMVISPDIDGLVSAALLRRKYKNAKVCAFYATRHLLIGDGYTPKDCKSAMWVDQDIVHPDIVCLGQHLILHDKDDVIVRRNSDSFNPNVHFRQSSKDSFRGVSMRSGGRDKYPFGTCHYLLHLDSSGGPYSPEEKALLAHADGSFASTYRYRHNCETWLDSMFEDSVFMKFLVKKYLTDKGTPSDERRFCHHQNLVEDLKGAGINRGKGQTSGGPLPGRWGELAGCQSVRFAENHRFETFTGKIHSVADCLRTISRFDVGELPQQISDLLSGEVASRFPEQVGGDFNEYVEAEDMFSLAFTSSKEFRCTKKFF
ncbi:MAG: hypothetical protein MPK06_06265 [Alphaproteobacteria bacterium]|nr:hypothetical protein [Alphaproteobacteria bacterium]MDA8004062.1 hypothetical protein [Alphaproteobacteria bacterium]MDA8006124.1 hypothetical protein [Alphaproteobacteria bacterium]MDA8013880.1 hypothetical protein [Alphaproteobacteria bacterium]